MDTVSKFLTPGIIFLLTLASGIWLSHSGKPLNTLLFTAHKLIALATVVLIVIQVYKMLKGSDVQALLIAFIVIAAVCIVALFATGALMSLGKPASTALLTIHQVAPVLGAFSMAAIIYLLAGRAL